MLTSQKKPVFRFSSQAAAKAVSRTEMPHKFDANSSVVVPSRSGNSTAVLF
jgi:hypothetical protein